MIDRLDDIYNWAARCLKMAGMQYVLEFTHEPFPGNPSLVGHSLKIDKGAWFQGAITMYTDADGRLKYDVDKMLGGRYSMKESLTQDNFKDKIQEAVEYVLGRRINMDREAGLVTNPVIATNIRNEYYITCDIDGQKQLRKPLKNHDRDNFIQKSYNCNEYYLDEFKYELIEKYFKTELALARNQSESRGIGR